MYYVHLSFHSLLGVCTPSARTVRRQLNAPLPHSFQVVTSITSAKRLLPNICIMGSGNARLDEISKCLKVGFPMPHIDGRLDLGRECYGDHHKSWNQSIFLRECCWANLVISGPRGLLWIGGGDQKGSTLWKAMHFSYWVALFLILATSRKLH